jgi:hypothetical protein
MLPREASFVALLEGPAQPPATTAPLESTLGKFRYNQFFESIARNPIGGAPLSEGSIGGRGDGRFPGQWRPVAGLGGFPLSAPIQTRDGRQRAIPVAIARRQLAEPERLAGWLVASCGIIHAGNPRWLPMGRR